MHRECLCFDNIVYVISYFNSLFIILVVDMNACIHLQPNLHGFRWMGWVKIFKMIYVRSRSQSWIGFDGCAGLILLSIAYVFVAWIYNFYFKGFYWCYDMMFMVYLLGGNSGVFIGNMKSINALILS